MKKLIDQFHRRLESTILRHRMLQDGDTAVIGFSGGPDSTALVAALAELAPRHGWSLHAFHVDHGIRGEASRADRIAARDLARNLGMSFKAVAIDGLDPSAVSEDQLRQVRFEAFHREAKRLKCRNLFLAHHRDDLAETLLMRLSRGAGLEGLAAFGPLEEFESLRLLRPFIEFSREEILHYLALRELEYRIDASNADPRFTRNRLRAQIMPQLAEALNPRISEALARTARLLAVDAEYLAQEAERETQKRAVFPAEGEAILSIADWKDLHEALRTRVLRNIIMAIAASALPPYSVHLADLDRLALQGRGRSYIMTQGNIVAVRERRQLRLFRFDQPSRPTREQIDQRMNK